MNSDKEREIAYLQTFVNKLPSNVTESVVAHRGFHSVTDTLNRPVENTLEAFQTAWNAGVTKCECDITLSADGNIFFAHDETFERLALVKDELHKSRVENLFSSDIKDLKLLDNSRPLFLSEMIKTLENIKKAELIIEIKETASSELISQNLYNLIKNMKQPSKNIPIVMSFKPSTCFKTQDIFNKHIKQENKPLVMLLIERINENNLTQRRLSDENYNESSIDLQDNHFIERIKENILRSDDVELDGVYFQFDTRMLTTGKVQQNISSLCDECVVGVWLGEGDEEYDNVTTIKILNDLGVMFINTDIPINYHVEKVIK